MTICNDCDGTGQTYCNDCHDNHQCDTCRGIGRISKQPIVCTYKGQDMVVVKGDLPTLWLKSSSAGKNKNWDHAANINDCVFKDI